MEIELYKDITHKEARQLQKHIDLKTEWFNWSETDNSNSVLNDRHSDIYQTVAERFNNSWKEAIYWYKPKSFLHNVDLELEATNKLFSIPIEVYLNEYLKRFINKGGLKQQVDSDKWAPVEKSPKQQLETRRDVKQKIIKQQHKFDHYRSALVVHLRHFIEENSKDVQQYEPHLIDNEDGENSFKRNELLGDIETAYRGVMCGNIYAYEHLIQQYVKPGSDLIRKMRDTTDQLVELSKDYVVVQYLEFTYSYQRGDKRISDDELIPEVQKCIEIEEGHISEERKTKRFITKEKKVKHTPIAEYIHYEVFPRRLESPRRLVDQVREVLPKVNNVKLVDGVLFKK